MIFDNDVVKFHADFFRPFFGFGFKRFVGFFPEPTGYQGGRIGRFGLQIDMKNGSVKGHAFFLVGRYIHAGFKQVAVIKHFVVAGGGSGICGRCSRFGVRLAEHFRQLFFEPFYKQFYIADDALGICHIYIV